MGISGGHRWTLRYVRLAKTLDSGAVASHYPVPTSKFEFCQAVTNAQGARLDLGYCV